MNDIKTTTFKDTISIVETGSSKIEEFDVNFNQSSKIVDYENYFVRNVEKYPYFVKFIKNTLSNFDLINESEIIEFIVKNMGLIEIIEKGASILKNHFPNYSFALEFDIDPEIPSFNKLVIYVKGDDESFDEDWEEIKKVSKEIRMLSLYDDTVKKLLSVDLW